MFETLIKEAASHLNLSGASVSAIVRGLMALMTSERVGGAEGFVDMFRRAGLGDTVTSWFGGKEGQAITPAQVETVLGTNSINALATASGLTRSTVTSAVAFLLPALVGRLTPHGVLPSRSALISQVSSYVAAPVASAYPRADKRGWRWVPFAAAALLALAGWLILRGPTGTIDPQLTLTNREGRVTYSGVVRDEGTRTTIINALQAAFGEANIDGTLRVDRNVRPAGWLPRLGDLFAVLKTPGVDFSLEGDRVNVGGWLSAAQRGSLTASLRDIFGAQSTIGSLGDAATDAVRAANSRALSALGAIGTSGVSPVAVVDAMNLSIINFESGSAQIPSADMEIIRRSAEAMNRAPSGSRIEIAGHTDNTGDTAGNIALAQARADAVRDALVAAGVPSAMLTTRGYGDSRPRASNETEFGRFQNRRIEYAVLP